MNSLYNKDQSTQPDSLEKDIKSIVLRPLAHAFGVMARQIDSGEYDLPKTIDEAEKLTENLINQAYNRIPTVIKAHDLKLAKHLAYELGYPEEEIIKYIELMR